MERNRNELDSTLREPVTFSDSGVREGDSGAEPDAVEISYFRDPYTIQGSSSAAEYSWITGSIFWTKIDLVYEMSADTKEIPTANRRESRKPLACSQNRICFSSLEHDGPNRPAGSSLIGNVRANPVGAPAPPL